MSRPRNENPCSECGSRPVKAKGKCGTCDQREWYRANRKPKDRAVVRTWNREKRGGRWFKRRDGPAPSLDPATVEELRGRGFYV